MGDNRKKLLAKEKRTKTATQFCIDGYLVDEVLKGLNGGIEIIGAKVFLGKAFSKHKIPIPNALKRMGVQSLREHRPDQEAMLVFDKTNKKSILEKVADVAKYIDTDAANAYFKYITLSNGHATGKFERTTKEIKPYDEDLRRKLTVLGLTDADGKISTLIQQLGAKKFECQISTEERRVIVCSKIG
jgi:hypothetical protein